MHGKKGQVAVRGMAVYGEPTPLGTGLTFHSLGAHQVGVNQLAYNDGAPKRFTVPTATKDGVKFSIREAEGGKPLFSGEVKDGIGDFSKWQAGTEARSKGGKGAGVLQKSVLQPMERIGNSGFGLCSSHLQLEGRWGRASLRGCGVEESRRRTEQG